MRRSLGLLLAAVGLALMAWPVVTWAYGLYWQERLAADLPPINTSAARPLLVRREEPPTPEPEPPPVRAAHSSKPRTSPPPSFQPTPSPQPAPTNAPPFSGTLPATPLGGAFARLAIPRIDLDALVVEGVDRFALRRGPGHLPKTGLPGEYRNCAIAAHRDGWFARLREVRTGDSVWLERRDGVFKYAVESRRVVTPDRGDLLNQGTNPVLTLITCTGPGYPHSQYRLLVFCRLRAVYPRDLCRN